MRSVPTELNDELLKEASFLVKLVELYFSSTLYITDCDVDLFYDDTLYQSRGFSFPSAEFSLSPRIDQVTLEFDNVELEFSSIALNQEIRGKKAIIKQAALQAPAKVVAVSTFFMGVVDSCRIRDQRASMNVANPWVYWKRKTPRRSHQSTCPWQFKHNETCRYSGTEEWCDQTYARCAVLGNTVNFGGFRWLPSLINKKLYWGRGMPVKSEE